MKTSSMFDIMGVTVEPDGDRDVMKLPVDTIKALFKEHGVVLLRGFTMDTDGFERFSNQFSADYMDHRGGGSLREVINKDGDKTILSVSYAFKPTKGEFDHEEQETFPLALHSDRSYTKSQPPLMWFYCVRPAVEKGQTILCDGVELYKALSPKTRAFFADHPIVYVRTYKDGEWQLWNQSDSLDDVRAYCRDNDLALTENDDGSITTRSTRPAIVTPRWCDRDAFVNSMLLVQWQEDTFNSTRSIVRLADDEPVPEEIWADIRVASDSLTREIDWHPGDVAMIDNTRMMHGRRAFADSKREIYVRMARSVPW